MIHLGFRLALPSFSLEVAVSLGARVTAIMGPSGAGKTSLLECIAGLRKHATGRIVVDDISFLDTAKSVRLSPERRRVGYVPQEPALFPHLTVRDNVRYGFRAADGDRAVDDTMALLEVASLARRSPRTLSGGEAQRVALARALVTRPRLLLLDEPLASLDVALKGRILPYLVRVRDEWKIPILYVTHHAGEALALADEALIVKDGRVEAKGAVREIVTPTLLAAMGGAATFDNVVHGVIASNDVEAGTAMLLPRGSIDRPNPRDISLAVPGGSGLAVGDYAAYRVRSDDVLLLRQKPEGISARNVLHGTVLEVETVGADAIVRIDCSGLELRARVTPAAIRDLNVTPAGDIWIAIKTHSFERLG